MRVLVTGGAGYIGSHAVKALIEKGHEPVIVDNLVYGHKFVVDKVLKTPFINCSIGDKDIISKIVNGTHKKLQNTVHENKVIEGVLHFAAFTYVGESVQKPIKYYQNNVIETINFLDVLCPSKNSTSNNKIPLVFSSTCAIYGNPKGIPIKEISSPNPINPYGRSKLIVENILSDLNKAYNFEFLIFRYFNAAGASPDTSLGELHEPETHLIPLAIMAAFDEIDNLKIFGTDYDTKDGTCIRDYIHVADLAEAHVMGLEKLLEGKFRKDNEEYINQRIFNLGNGKGVSVREIINSVEKITGRSINYVEDGRRIGDPPILIADYKKAKEYLGWEPKIKDIDIIVKHACNWYLKLKEQKL